MHNRELLEKCPTLNGYARFVAIIRENLESIGLTEAVEKAVEECIRQDILKDFFMEQRSEVVAMAIYEYNEEYAMRATYENGRNQAMVHNIEAVMKNLGLTLEKACSVLDVSVEEYQRAKIQN